MKYYPEQKDVKAFYQYHNSPRAYWLFTDTEKVFGKEAILCKGYIHPVPVAKWKIKEIYNL